MGWPRRLAALLDVVALLADLGVPEEGDGDTTSSVMLIRVAGADQDVAGTL
jgi:hypothetical protein